jgi:Zn-dependent protease with chaperone function
MSDDTLLLHDNILPESFIGAYYDGQSSTAQTVSVVLMGTNVALFGEGWTKRVPASEIRASEPLERAPVLLRLPDGSSCELPTSPLLLGRLRQVGLRAPRVSPWQGDRRLAWLALAFLVAIIAVFYVYLLPMLAQFGAALVPDRVKQQLGQTTLATLKRDWLDDSRLPPQLQQAVRERFEALRGPRQHNAARLELHAVRRGSDGKPVIGPNAFALPGGTIVLTDTLAEQLSGDLDALSGVLAHELGHVARDHSTQALIKAGALGALGAALIGDYSAVLAGAPALIGQLHYSREAERQADQFARDRLCEQGVDPRRLAAFFDKMLREKESALSMPAFLSSHPPSNARAAFFREPCGA